MFKPVKWTPKLRKFARSVQRNPRLRWNRKLQWLVARIGPGMPKIRYSQREMMRRNLCPWRKRRFFHRLTMPIWAGLQSDCSKSTMSKVRYHKQSIRLKRSSSFRFHAERRLRYQSQVKERTQAALQKLASLPDTVRRTSYLVEPTFTRICIGGKLRIVKGNYKPWFKGHRTYWRPRPVFWDRPSRIRLLRRRLKKRKKHKVTDPKVFNTFSIRTRVKRQLLNFAKLAGNEEISTQYALLFNKMKRWKVQVQNQVRRRWNLKPLNKVKPRLSWRLLRTARWRRKRLKILRRQLRRRKREIIRDSFLKKLPIITRCTISKARMFNYKSGSRLKVAYHLESKTTHDRNKVRVAVAKRKVSSFNYRRSLFKVTTSQQLGIAHDKLARQLKLFSHRTLDFVSARVAKHFETRSYTKELRTRRVASVTCQVPIRVSPVRMERQTLRRATSEIYNATDPINAILNSSLYQNKLEEKAIDVHFELEDALLFANRFQNLS